MKKFRFSSSAKTGYALAVAGALAFSAKAIFIKAAYGFGADSVSFLSLRMLFALPIYVLIFIFSPKTPLAGQKLRKSDWAGMFLFGLIGYYLASWLDFSGLQYITAGLERLVLFTYPSFTLFISVLIFGKKLLKVQIWAVLLTYGGILIAFVGDLSLYDQKDVWTGSSFVLASSLIFSIYLIGTGRLVEKFGTLRYTTLSMSAAAVGVIIHTYFHNGLEISGFAPEVYQLGLLTAILSTVLSSFLLSAGIRRIGAENAALAGSVGPISTIVLANIFLHEAITLPQIFGTILVIAGVLMLSRNKE